MKKKLILAYSGGLDTSIICKWLDLKGYQVICMVADIGQPENFSELKKKAIASGAKKIVVKDLRKEFIVDYVYPSIAFHALYEGRYLLGTSLARPLIAKAMVDVARVEKASSFAHGATGKGNDQVRFELSLQALSPESKIIAPWKISEFYSLIKGRKEAMDFARKHNIPIKATTKTPWSSDANLLHISFEAGILENPACKPPEKMFEYSVSPEKAPNRITPLTIDFVKGMAVAVNGKRVGPVALMEKLNQVGGKNGIGRIDIVESRFVGMKSRGVYETPGGSILHLAHRDLETLTLSRSLIQLKNTLMPHFASLVYNGFWFGHEMRCLLALLNETQKPISGRVYLELYKGNVTVIGRESRNSLYDDKVASMEDDAGAYHPEDAVGFIRLNALPLIMEAKRDNRMNKNGKKR